MKNISITIIIFIQVLLFSCTNKGKDYTVSGILYRDCSKTQVMRGVSIQVEGRKVGMGGGLTLGSGQTDDNGRFSFTYNTKDLGDPDVSLVAYSNSGIGRVELQNGLRGYQDIVGLFLYMNSKTQINLKVSTNRIFTINDTLYYSSYPVEKKIIKPTNNQVLEVLSGSWIDGEKMIGWGIGYADYQKSVISGPNPIPQQYNTIRFTFPSCGQNGKVLINIQ